MDNVGDFPATAAMAASGFYLTVGEVPEIRGSLQKGLFVRAGLPLHPTGFRSSAGFATSSRTAVADIGLLRILLPMSRISPLFGDFGRGMLPWLKAFIFSSPSKAFVFNLSFFHFLLTFMKNLERLLNHQTVISDFSQSKLSQNLVLETKLGFGHKTRIRLQNQVLKYHPDRH
ncbi:uncharacterized protein LOC116263938 isoform X2 [Nymphaea colorata]|nr:uncharacterized protein LOC116263938 isoform X2 [Nymphaea colorata]